MTISPTNLTVVHALNSWLTGKNVAAFQFHSWNVYFYIKCALWLTYSGIQHVLLVLYLLKLTSHYYARTRRQWQSQHQVSETPENLKVGSTCFSLCLACVLSSNPSPGPFSKWHRTTMLTSTYRCSRMNNSLHMSMSNSEIQKIFTRKSNQGPSWILIPFIMHHNLVWLLITWQLRSLLLMLGNALPCHLLP